MGQKVGSEIRYTHRVVPLAEMKRTWVESGTLHPYWAALLAEMPSKVAVRKVQSRASLGTEEGEAWLRLRLEAACEKACPCPSVPQEVALASSLVVVA